MFGMTTVQEMPVAYLTDYAVWDSYVASIWHKLLSHLIPHQLSTVIEVAPGTSTKIGEALKSSDFTGTLYIIEPDKHALARITKRYSELLPNAVLIPLNHSLTDSLGYLPINPDAILSSHPLDDMILACAPQLTEGKSLFSWTVNPTTQLSSEFLDHWNALQITPGAIEVIKNKVAKQWVTMHHTIKPKSIIISQYSSATLAMHNLQNLNQHATQLLNHLKKQFGTKESKELYTKGQELFNQIENYNNNHIGNEVLNAQNWLFLRAE
jgi:hypothetical protein